MQNSARPTLVGTTVRKDEYGRYVATRILSCGARIRGKSRDRVEALAIADRNMDFYLARPYATKSVSQEKGSNS